MAEVNWPMDFRIFLLMFCSANSWGSSVLAARIWNQLSRHRFANCFLLNASIAVLITATYFATILAISIIETLLGGKKSDTAENGGGSVTVLPLRTCFWISNIGVCTMLTFLFSIGLIAVQRVYLTVNAVLESKFKLIPKDYSRRSQIIISLIVFSWLSTIVLRSIRIAYEEEATVQYLKDVDVHEHEFASQVSKLTFASWPNLTRARNNNGTTGRSPAHPSNASGRNEFIQSQLKEAVMRNLLCHCNSYGVSTQVLPLPSIQSEQSLSGDNDTEQEQDGIEKQFITIRNRPIRHYIFATVFPLIAISYCISLRICKQMMSTEGSITPTNNGETSRRYDLSPETRFILNYSLQLTEMFRPTIYALMAMAVATIILLYLKYVHSLAVDMQPYFFPCVHILCNIIWMTHNLSCLYQLHKADNQIFHSPTNSDLTGGPPADPLSGGLATVYTIPSLGVTDDEQDSRDGTSEQPSEQHPPMSPSPSVASIFGVKVNFSRRGLNISRSINFSRSLADSPPPPPPGSPISYLSVSSLWSNSASTPGGSSSAKNNHKQHGPRFTAKISMTRTSPFPWPPIAETGEDGSGPDGSAASKAPKGVQDAQVKITAVTVSATDSSNLPLLNTEQYDSGPATIKVEKRGQDDSQGSFKERNRDIESQMPRRLSSDTNTSDNVPNSRNQISSDKMTTKRPRRQSSKHHRRLTPLPTTTVQFRRKGSIKLLPIENVTPPTPSNGPNWTACKTPQMLHHLNEILEIEEV